MFVCEKCDKDTYGGQLAKMAIMRSYGACEECGIAGNCTDIPSKHMPAPVEKNPNAEDIPFREIAKEPKKLPAP